MDTKMDTKIDEGDDLIEGLLRLPFKIRHPCDKIRIVETGRPCPPLPELSCRHVEKNRQYTRTFSAAYYKKFAWLAGSTHLKKLFCWPCLLFSKETTTWNSVGFVGLNYLSSGCMKHEKSAAHLAAYKTLQLYGRQPVYNRLASTKEQSTALAHNEKVKKNRDVLRRFIDVVATLGNLDDESGELTDSGLYRALIKLLARYDLTLSVRLQKPKIFGHTTPAAIKNVLIDAIADVIVDRVKAEVARAPFVAILIDETSNAAYRSQLATALRYVDEDGVCRERFLHFTNVGADRNAQRLLQHVDEVVNRFECAAKLVAYTLDGATMATNDVREFQTLMSARYPSTSFVHSRAHPLDTVLLQSAEQIKECRTFFSTLTAISQFFAHSTLRTHTLNEFIGEQLPSSDPSRWSFSATLVHIVHGYGTRLKEFFVRIENEPVDHTPAEVAMASGFVRFLSKFDTNVLIVIFYHIFESFEPFFHTLQNQSISVYDCEVGLNEFHSHLQKLRNEEFEIILNEANAATNFDTLDNDQPKIKREKIDDRFAQLLRIILDTLIEQIDMRFKSQEGLKFVSLLNRENFVEFHKNFTIVPEILIGKVERDYSDHFDILRLKSELRVFYSDEECRSLTLTDILAYIKLNKLEDVFVDVYKLTNLALTLPSTTVSTHKTFSAHQRIRNYLRGRQGQTMAGSLSICSIEKEILEEFYMRSVETFYDEVTRKFVESKDRDLAFTYR